MKPAQFLQRFRIESPKRFSLDDFDPAETAGFKRSAAEATVKKHIERLADLQQRLYAEDRWALLVILQGVDAAGKDSAIRRLTTGLNPQGCNVHPFKAPTADELDHDFLWRAVKRLPRRGDIGIFNRSYYEEVLVVRVHPELLGNERLPRAVVSKQIWQERFEDINAFERHLVRNGTAIVKFHLRISQEEQKKRLIERLDDPAKRWKFSMGDIAERKLWNRHMRAYEEMIRMTSTREAPWYVVPADHKWFARLLIATAMVDVLDRMQLEYPKADRAALREMRRLRAELAAD